jgi:type IV pilus assembly protein PilA
MVKQPKGFSLIELLIVVAIILIIAAIAIPNFMRARMAANDSSASASMRTINTGELAYFNAYPSVGYPATLVPLGGASPCVAAAATSCLIDDSLATNGGGNGKSGYSFAATGSTGGGSLVNNQYYATGTPLSVMHGTKAYCSVQDAVLRVQPTGTITVVGGYGACQALQPMNP